ncbi:MAG: hypothetical protein R3C11_26750 [Planctomycetaceae bacterium]
MNFEDWEVKRQIVGILAILCWIATGIFYLTNPESELFLGASVRIAIVLSAIWLALPSIMNSALVRLSGKWWVTFGLGTLAAVIRPRLAPGVLVVLVVLSFLWKPKAAPRDKEQSSAQPKQKIDSSSTEK